jgi:hypothetical protein
VTTNAGFVSLDLARLDRSHRLNSMIRYQQMHSSYETAMFGYDLLDKSKCLLLAATRIPFYSVQRQSRPIAAWDSALNVAVSSRAGWSGPLT